MAACSTEGWKNRLKCSCNPGCNRRGILCRLPLKTPGFLCKLSRRDGCLLELVQRWVEMGLWDQPTCPAGMARWEGIQEESNLDLDSWPAFGSSCCVWVGLKLLQWMLQAQLLPAQPHPPPLSSVLILQSSVSHQVLLLQYFWCSLQLMLGDLNCQNFNYLCRLKKKTY